MSEMEKIVELEGKITELEAWKKSSTQAMLNLFKIIGIITDSIRSYVKARVEDED